MARLPEFDTAPVSTEGSSALGQVAAARRATLGVFEKGFAIMGQELVKSQMQRASADLSRGLNEIELELDSKKLFTTQEIRDRLGAAYESLDPTVKSQLTRKAVDPQSGQLVEQDREDIPSWVVSGPIYDKRSKDVLRDASQQFNSEGWATDFQDKAAQDVQARKMRLAQKQLKEFHDYTREQDTASAIDFANTGNYIAARATIEMSRTMDLDYKKKVLDHVDKIEQVAPVYEAIRREDFGTMAQLAGKLNDPKEFTKLSPAERTAFSERLKAEINQFTVAAERAQERQVKALAEAGWNGIFAKERAGLPVSYKDIPPPGTIHADAQKSMIEYVDKLNKGEKPETDMVLYAGLSQIARNPKEFANVDLLKYRNRLSDSDFKHFVDLQLGAKNGNPEAFDAFQTTDEAINYRLRGYNIDPSAKNDNDTSGKIGFVKTLIQHELAAEQKGQNGKRLGVVERDAIIDRVLSREIDPKSGFFDGTSIPAYKAKIPASMASTFRIAAQQLDPKGMSTKSGRVETLKTQYKDFTFYNPQISRAWEVQAGGSILPDDAVKVWYRLKSRWGQLEGRLRASGGWTEDPALRQKRLVQLAVQEALAER